MFAKNKTSHSFFIIFYAFILLMIWFGINKLTYADDQFFSHALDHRTLSSYLLSRYDSWTGRVILEAYTVETINSPLIFRTSIFACFMLMTYAVWSITIRDILHYSIGMPLIGITFLMIESSVARDSMWWVTGFYNYLLPVSFGLFSLSVLLREKKSSGRLKILSIFAAIIACAAEQSAIFLILVTIFIIIIRGRRELKPYSVMFLTLSIASAFILFYSPGNYIRFGVESSRYMPEIYQRNILQNISIGAGRIHAHLTDPSNLIYFASILLALFTIHKSKLETSRQDKIASYILILAACIFATRELYVSSMLGYFNNNEILSSTNWWFFSSYTSIAYSFITISALLYVSATKIEINKIALISFISILLGTLVTLAIGLSPTIYASGQRILFVLDVSMIIYIFCLVRHLCTSKQII
jgi:hypothetical protein